MPQSQNRAAAAPSLQQANTPMWKIFDMPHTYAVAVIFACAVYVDSLSEESIVNKTLISTQETLIEIGRTGPIVLTQEFFGLESIFIAKLILTILALLSGYLGYQLIDKFVLDKPKDSQDDNMPSFTPKLTSKQYEKQKMEFTRTELEKLTDSVEYKRHATKKLKEAKDAPSRSVLFTKKEADDSFARMGSQGMRHNVSAVLDLDDSDSLLEVGPRTSTSGKGKKQKQTPSTAFVSESKPKEKSRTHRSFAE